MEAVPPRGRGPSKHASKGSGGDAFSVRTWTKRAEVRKEFSRRVLAITVEDEPDERRRSRSRSVAWRAADGTPVRPVLEAMKADGFFKPVRNRSCPTEELGSEADGPWPDERPLAWAK